MTYVLQIPINLKAALRKGAERSQHSVGSKHSFLAVIFLKGSMLPQDPLCRKKRLMPAELFHPSSHGMLQDLQ